MQTQQPNTDKNANKNLDTKTDTKNVQNKDVQSREIQTKDKNLQGQGTEQKDVEGKASFDVSARGDQGRKQELQGKGQDFSGKIKAHMDVVCSNDGKFAIVDHVEGSSLKLAKDDQGKHHYLPLSWITSVDEKVHIDRPGDQAMRDWTTQPS